MSECTIKKSLTDALLKDPKHKYFTCHMFSMVNGLNFEARTKNVSTGVALLNDGITVCEGSSRKLTFGPGVDQLINHTDGSAILTMSLVIAMLVIMLVQMFL